MRQARGGGQVVQMMRGALWPAAVAVAALLCMAPAQASASSDFWGVVDGSAHLGKGEWTKMARGGVDEVRRSIFWYQVEGTKGTFDWAAADHVIGAAASQGMSVLPALYGTPAYAGKTPATPPLGSSAARNEWRDFLQRAVQRYGPGGDYWTSVYPTQYPGAAPMPIHQWQIWNEPNIPSGFQPRPSPKRYATLLKISHDAILGQDPGAKIVLAGMPGFSDYRGWKFLRRLYGVHGIKRDFDVVATNPYSLTVAGVGTAIKHMRAVMNHHRDRRKPLWVTELGWGSAHPDGGLNVGLKGQKRMLTGAFKLVSHHRRKWGVDRLFWFEWRDPSAHDQPRGCPWCGHAGLFRHNRKPKPAWASYKHFARR